MDGGHVSSAQNRYRILPRAEKVKPSSLHLGFSCVMKRKKEERKEEIAEFSDPKIKNPGRINEYPVHVLCFPDSE